MKVSSPVLGGIPLTTLLFVALCISAPKAGGSSSGALLELVDLAGERISRLEASGIAYFAGRLIVVDDTLNSLFVFDRQGKLSYRIESGRFPTDRAKFEDLAFDETTGVFFAVGSHEGFNSEFLERTSVFLRFRLVDRDGVLAVDEESVTQLPLFKSFGLLGLWKPEGMKIEGLAYDPLGDNLYVGLRQPSDKARVYRFVPGDLNEEGPEWEPPLPEKVVSFDAGRIGETPFCISALLWVPEQQGLLIATSTEDETTHEFLGNRLWFYSPERGVMLLKDTFDRGMKAEGLAIGDNRLLITYDNDQDDTEIPSYLRVLPLEPLLDSL
jgi:hypothetical protein